MVLANPCVYCVNYQGLSSRPTSIIQRYKHKNREKYGWSTRFRLQTPTHPISHIEDWHLWLGCRSLEAHRRWVNVNKFYLQAVNIICLTCLCPLRGYVRDMVINVIYFSHLWVMLQRFIWIYIRWNNNAVEIYQVYMKNIFEMNSYIWPPDMTIRFIKSITTALMNL